jgi:hypothetical protein
VAAPRAQVTRATGVGRRFDGGCQAVLAQTRQGAIGPGRACQPGHPPQHGGRQQRQLAHETHGVPPRGRAIRNGWCRRAAWLRDWPFRIHSASLSAAGAARISLAACAVSQAVLVLQPHFVVATFVAIVQTRPDTPPMAIKKEVRTAKCGWRIRLSRSSRRPSAQAGDRTTVMPIFLAIARKITGPTAGLEPAICCLRTGGGVVGRSRCLATSLAPFCGLVNG